MFLTACFQYFSAFFCYNSNNFLALNLFVTNKPFPFHKV
ncbi:hypothetical protein CYK57_00977 [Actinobacillus pleuropneumoniae]|uniref:Uncharacterized protein n=1 Tax=Actinobacillus pleuropneumoniae serovar 6 str. Femo TaxID=754256 RepID=A0A828PLI4_ACTPL|nr:hypothetical protein appser2_7950 [Actinobacillus pleuropneumoniae serovar 2 str. S1536]EFM90004.1 hypothetical protein appser4_8400 [Actinobacillus pleuropneumoniae serovar 4 str. M62]EFM92053.1 hypothetical protein appser6_9610 [Actinobacillus pleuropneumoniae serovar 6 str. Femo]EFM96510.1 hypothetical protein appser10_8750 [Actinobacillus pleuropneumoniae serovar 10 str. D13039]QSZ38842.1 hypothetical protein CYK57_00977 [Actinobacillus pleuropneumoniae]